MRAVANALLLAAALLSLLSLPRLDTSPLFLAPAAVAVGVMASVVAAGGWTWLAVIFGAIAPLALAWIGPWNTTVGLSVVCLMWLAPRAWVARSHRDLVVLVVSAATASVVAGVVMSHFMEAPVAQHIAACVFAGAALAITTVAVRAEPPVAHALEVAGRALDGPVREALLRAAEARRSLQRHPSSRRGNWRLWRRLAAWADARVGLEGVPRPDTDQQRRELDREILLLVERLGSPTPSMDAPGAASGQTLTQEPVGAGTAPCGQAPSEGASHAPAAVTTPEPQQSGGSAQ
ncbi:MAG: hypothetical protein MUF54_25725 [Polyangiaceae bacterium]|jgi:hypothetical protein|nr:hypothetical protein [Polyangiaceae bacterium]